MFQVAWAIPVKNKKQKNKKDLKRKYSKVQDHKEIDISLIYSATNLERKCLLSLDNMYFELND